jgi:hypothetical protein
MSLLVLVFVFVFWPLVITGPFVGLVTNGYSLNGVGVLRFTQAGF